MPRGVHTDAACWTCRLRRKKCDKVIPECGSCLNLGIPCHTGSTKPDWMDGGSGQKAKGEEIKKLIKVSASSRNMKGDFPFQITSQDDYIRQHESGEMESSSGAVLHPAPTDCSGLQASKPASLADLSPHTSSGVEDQAESQSSETRLAALGPAWEQDFTMIYIDFVFPLLFPFYQPPAVATGRAWLLSFVKQNRATTHAVLSLSSFFFTFGLADVFPGKHDACRYTMWGQVVDQARMSFGMLSVDLAAMTEPGHEATLLEKTRMMGTIVHLMTFDLFVGRSSDWEAHLAPALLLFEDIAKDVELEPGEEIGFSTILDAMNWPRPYFPGFQIRLWNPDQANFRFFSAILIVIDILASTSIRAEPRLKHFHSTFLGEVPPEEISQPLDLFSFVGCQTWVLLVIGEIATLDAWKSRGRPDFDQQKFNSHATEIFKRLESGLGVSVQSSQSLPFVGSSMWYRPGHSRSGGIRSLVPTRIWAHAAYIYLSTVTSGPSLDISTIQWHTAAISKLLRDLDEPSQIRTLAWPVCIAGCFSHDEEEQSYFQASLASVGDIQLRSAALESSNIMKRVWSCRDNVEGYKYDAAMCLNIMGYPALLF